MKIRAYGASDIEDDANDKLCNEDIDSNLKRRTHSYGSSSNRSDINIDDHDS